VLVDEKMVVSYFLKSCAAFGAPQLAKESRTLSIVLGGFLKAAFASLTAWCA